jgi:hypothetical protein
MVRMAGSSGSQYRTFHQVLILTPTRKTDRFVRAASRQQPSIGHDLTSSWHVPNKFSAIPSPFPAKALPA